jgi:hypothetical protein
MDNARCNHYIDKCFAEKAMRKVVTFVDCEIIRHAKVKAHGPLARLRVRVDHRMRQPAPPVRHHVQAIPVRQPLGRDSLYDLGERGKHCGAGSGAFDDVVHGVGEGRGLKAAVNVPAGASDFGASRKRQRSVSG